MASLGMPIETSKTWKLVRSMTLTEVLAYRGTEVSTGEKLSKSLVRVSSAMNI